MNILITGATGFVGSHLAEACVARNWQTACLVRQTSDRKWLQNLPVEFVVGDLSDVEKLKSAVSGKDIIFHVAGLTKARSFAEFVRANAEGTKNLLEASARYAPMLKMFVHTSSLAAVGPSPTLAPISESHPPRPITNYGRSKLLSEAYCREYSNRIPVSIIRPPAVYGERDKDIFEFFKIVNKGIAPALGDHEKHLSIVHVKDLVRAYILIALEKSANGRAFFIANKEIYPFSYLIECLAKALNKASVIKIRVSHELLKIAASISEEIGRMTGQVVPFNRQKAIELSQRYWTCDPSLAKETLGFESQIPLNIGFKDTADWYKQVGWL